jgi:hypothetical protein
MPPLRLIFFVRKPLVCEKLSDVGHIFVAEGAYCTTITMFSTHQHMKATIMAAKNKKKVTRSTTLVPSLVQVLLM